MIASPSHTHDCNKCVFLGDYPDVDGRPLDLYVCQQNGMPTVIARYGSRGYQYTSGLSLASHDPALAEAKRRAQEKGLLP